MPNVTESSASRFADLFKGNDRSHGSWDPDGVNETVKTSIPDGGYLRHLEGKTNLGVVPVMDDGTCWFGAIDIDAHEQDEYIDLGDLVGQVVANRLPLVVCRSKSGGAHLYMFGKEPMNAHLVRRALATWAADLGYRGVEVFPKQSELKPDDQGDVAYGNWINLPYFNSGDTNRYAMVMRRPGTLEEFLADAEGHAVKDEQIRGLLIRDHKEAPPCLQTLILDGASPGHRNEVLFNLAIYMKRKSPNSFRAETKNLANQVFTRPLDRKEMDKTISSASRRDYHYRCLEEPMCDLCDRSTCTGRAFGITYNELQELKENDDMPQFERLIKYDSEAVTWGLVVDGVEIPVSTPVLFNFKLLREAIAERLTKVIPPMQAKQWSKKLGEMMQEAHVEEVPEEATTPGLMRAKLHEFLHKADLSADGDDVELRRTLNRGLPVVQTIRNMPTICFRGSDFVGFLKRTRNEELKGVNLWLALKKSGIEHARIRIPGDTTRPVWFVPFEQETGDIDIPDYDPGY